MPSVEENLKTLKITIPKPSAPAANYVPWSRSGNLIYVAGQLPIENGNVKYVGKVGQFVAQNEAVMAARLCAINIIAQVQSALDGDLERVRRIIKLGGFINCIPEFSEHPKIINGASDLMVDVFGEKGRHSRFAVGAVSLPLGAAVEIDAIVEIE